jgi:hypothetical protein
MATREIIPPADRLAIVEALQGARFPATREELIEWARRHGAYETVIESLRAIGPGPYRGTREVADAVGAQVAPSGAGSGPRGLSAAGDDRADHPAPMSTPGLQP